jgi:mono/diheme cytochrome c family protein
MRIPFGPALALAALLAAPVHAQQADLGAELYRHYCATCHGADATGDGPMAPALVLQPPDLTTLTVRFGGAFPMQRVIDRIDGQDPLVAHGSPMPVYGPFFEGVQNIALKAPNGQPVLVSAPIADLITFLLEIQAP